MTQARPPVQPPDERSLASTRLLIDLVTNTLDPGYRAAATRRDPARSRPWYDTPLAAVGCLLIGLVVVVAYVHTNRGAPEAQKVHDSLVQRVRTAQHTAAGLSRQLATAEKNLAAARDAALPASGALAQDLNRAELAAGAVAVKGPGIVVTLSDPKRAAPSSGGVQRGGTIPISQGNILTDRDVRSVVNELWSDGAEAISVNNIRLTPTSAIRFAGEAVLVDFQPITSPYTMRAIGDSDGLSTNFAASEVASRYQTLKGADHIGFDFTGEDHLSLPANTPALPRYAKILPPHPRRGHK